MGQTFDPLSYEPLYLDSGKVILAIGENHVEGILVDRELSEKVLINYFLHPLV